MRPAYLIIVLALPGLAATPSSIDQTQAKQIVETSKNINDASRQLLIYASGVDQLIQNNFTFNIPGSTETITLSPDQQQSMLKTTRYTTLKAQLQALVDSLP